MSTTSRIVSMLLASTCESASQAFQKFQKDVRIFHWKPELRLATNSFASPRRLQHGLTITFTLSSSPPPRRRRRPR